MNKTQPAPTSTPLRACPNCGREMGGGITCQFCQQVDGLLTGVHLSSAGKRLGAHLLDGVIAVFTLVIGWLIWSLIVFKNGQTPAKQLLGMRIVKVRTGRHASWGATFVREFIAKTVIGVMGVITFGLGLTPAYFWICWDKNNQELWDKMVGTVVVDDGDKQLD